MDPQHESTSPAQERLHNQPLPPLMRAFQNWTLGLSAFSACYHLCMRFVFHKHGRISYPFSLNKQERFADFLVFADKFQHFHTDRFYNTGFPIIYPVPVSVFFEFFFKYMAPHSLLAMVIFIGLALTIPAALFGYALYCRGISAGRAALFVSIVCLLSWPADLIFDGANSEALVWLVMAIAMWAYATERLWTASIFLGIAASLKIFPFVFLALFLTRRDLGKAFAGAGTCLLITVASFKIVGPTMSASLHGFLNGLTFANTYYFSKWRNLEQGVDHSLFSVFKTFLVVVRHSPGINFARWLRLYNLATAGGGAILYFLRIRYMPLLNQVLIFSIVCIYFTPFSGDGTLIHLYYPLGMLFFLAIRAYRDRLEIQGLSTVIYCMVFCLSAESFLFLRYRSQDFSFIAATHDQDFRLIGVAHAIGLGIMLVTALRYPLGPPLDAGLGPIVLSQPVTSWAAGPKAD
jgi:hypothetical protein